MSSKTINFFSEAIDFHLENPDSTLKWISTVILQEGKHLGEINYVFCSDNYLLELNQKYLRHNTYTDVITFDYVEENKLSGDIFISIERVMENSKKLNIELFDELSRVMIHGVLHLIGYKDKTPEEQRTIREKEDFYLALRQ